ncbi:MAG: NAD-dependent epimerase/dehydratase family protein [Gemmatimonadota bacterium]
MTTRALVAGAGGFIGHHLVTYLKERGYWVRGADLKEPEFEPTKADEFLPVAPRVAQSCRRGSAQWGSAPVMPTDRTGYDGRMFAREAR